MSTEIREISVCCDTPGNGVQGLADYALVADGVTVTTNYYGGQRDEIV
jgi:hypothetical protein